MPLFPNDACTEGYSPEGGTVLRVEGNFSKLGISRLGKGVGWLGGGWCLQVSPSCPFLPSCLQGGRKLLTHDVSKCTGQSNQ